MLKRFFRWGLWLIVVAILVIIYGEWNRVCYIKELQEKEALLVQDLKEATRQTATAKRLLDLTKARYELETKVCQIRQLPFHKPIDYRWIKKAEFKNYILGKLDKEYPPEEFRSYEWALKQIGLIPQSVDLRGMMIDLLAQDTAAFYDLDEHLLYTFESPNGKDLSRSRDDQMILIHELVHVLQDQNFDLTSLPLKVKDNDDAMLAALALIEGDANHHMGKYLWGDSPPLLSKEFKDEASFTEKEPSSVPRYVQDALDFPYDEGEKWVVEIYNQGGMAALNAAFKDPPKSTEQILHLEKYLGPNKDLPKTVTFFFKAEEGWKKLHENVVGELGIRSLFTDLYGREKASQIAAGWGGDRYLFYEVSPEKRVLLWKIIWDTKKDAREFFDALEKLYRERYETEKTPPSDPSDSVFFSVAHQKQNMTIRDHIVWFLDMPDIKMMKVFLPEWKKEKKEK